LNEQPRATNIAGLPSGNGLAAVKLATAAMATLEFVNLVAAAQGGQKSHAGKEE
jgi:hypothetical protein